MCLLIWVVGRIYFLAVVGVRSLGLQWLSAEGTCVPWVVASFLHLQSQHGRSVPLTLGISCLFLLTSLGLLLLLLRAYVISLGLH